MDKEERWNNTADITNKLLKGYYKSYQIGKRINTLAKLLWKRHNLGYNDVMNDFLCYYFGEKLDEIQITSRGLIAISLHRFLFHTLKKADREKEIHQQYIDERRCLVEEHLRDWDNRWASVKHEYGEVYNGEDLETETYTPEDYYFAKVLAGRAEKFLSQDDLDCLVMGASREDIAKENGISKKAYDKQLERKRIALENDLDEVGWNQIYKKLF